MGIPRAQPLDQDRPVSRAWLWAVAVAVAAFLFRLVPVLRGGGLFGFGNYDDGVYFVSAVGLVHGLLPYRDFLLLHPPAITVLLAPFAALAQLTSDSYGFAAARVAWMLLGAANAVLIWKILRPIGLVAAVFGGFGYAVFYPAVYADHSTLLESPATTALLIAILLLQPLIHDDSLPRGKALAAGVLLGLGMTIKIWGAVTLLIVLGWLLLLRRYGAALRVALASAATATVICLPFFASAPTAMWNQVVRDQLFRRGGSDVNALERLDRIAGLAIVSRSYPAAITVAAVIALLGCAALAWSYREARLPVLLMLGHGLLLLITPTWFPHFAAFTAAPVALTAGAGIGRLIALIRAGPVRIAVGAVLVAAPTRVRERLVDNQLRPPLPQGVPSSDGLRAGLRHLRRPDRPGGDRLVEPQPESRLPVHRRSRRELPRPGCRRRPQSVPQPQPGIPALRARLPAYWFGDHLDQILGRSGLQCEDDCRS